MKSHTYYKGIFRVCCNEDANLEKPVEAGDGSTYRRCKVCGRRHFNFYCEPGVLGIETHKLEKLTEEQLYDLVDFILSKKRKHVGKNVGQGLRIELNPAYQHQRARSGDGRRYSLGLSSSDKRAPGKNKQ